MTIDLNDLSTKELNALISQAKKQKTRLAKRKPIAAVRRQITAAAELAGYTVSELFGTAAKSGKPAKQAKPTKKASSRKGKKLGKVAPKYRNPANRTETWTGRGKQPRWLAAEVANGKTVESFLIDKSSARKAPARKTAAKKTKARKVTAKKATAKKAGAKKTKAKKARAKKTSARKAK